MTELILKGVDIILDAIIRGMQDDPDIDTTQAEQTAKELKARLEEYREARAELDAMKV